MQITGLTKENVYDYLDFLPVDIAECIGREFTCGFVCIKDGEDSPSAGIIWELKQGDDELDIKSHILFMKALDEESANVLMDEYTESALLAECGYSYYSLPNTLEGIEINALKKAGFFMEEKESSVISVPLSEIIKRLLKHGDDNFDNIKPLSRAEDRFFSSMIAELEFEGSHGICDDLSFLPREYFDNDVSCYYEDDEEVYAIVLVHEKPSGKIELDLLHSHDKDPNTLIHIMKKTVLLAEAKYDPSTEFLIDRHDERSLSLCQILFPKKTGEMVYEGMRKENIPQSEEIDTRFYNEEEWDEDFEEY